MTTSKDTIIDKKKNLSLEDTSSLIKVIKKEDANLQNHTQVILEEENPENENPNLNNSDTKIHSKQPIVQHKDLATLETYLKDFCTNNKLKLETAIDKQTFTLTDPKTKTPYCTLTPGCVSFTGKDEAKVQQCLELVIFSTTGMNLDEYAKDANKQPIKLEVSTAIEDAVNKVLKDKGLDALITVNGQTTKKAEQDQELIDDKSKNSPSKQSKEKEEKSVNTTKETKEQLNAVKEKNKDGNELKNQNDHTNSANSSVTTKPSNK